MVELIKLNCFQLKFQQNALLILSGVASGGIGAYGSTLAKAGSGIFKLFVRMGTGFVAGIKWREKML